MEIERKFLVTVLPNLTKTLSYTIEQHYLSYEPEVRLRLINDVRCVLTIKSNGNLARREVDIIIPRNKYDELFKMSIGNMIYKRRYEILKEPYKFEIDVFINRSLILVEVEFNSEDEANNFVPPDWFGEEVTYEPKYKNQYLARN